MAKIILEFDSNEEFEEAKTGLTGTQWKAVMWQLDQQLRDTTKYGKSIIHRNTQATDQEIETVEAVRELIRNLLQDFELSL